MTTLSEDTIRKAVEIAPGFEISDENKGYEGFWFNLPHFQEAHSSWQTALDALAAALVRVVDALPNHYCFHASDGGSYVIREGAQNDEYLSKAEDPDRTENTINAIVEFSQQHPEVFK